MTAGNIARGRLRMRRRVLGSIALAAGAGTLAVAAGFRWLDGRRFGGGFSKGLELHREGRYDEAASVFASAAERRPGDPTPLIMLGSAYANGRRFKEAVDSFTAAIELQPDRPVLYVYRGEALLGIGREAEARRDFERALALSGGEGGGASAARTHLGAMRQKPGVSTRPGSESSEKPWPRGPEN